MATFEEIFARLSPESQEAWKATQGIVRKLPAVFEGLDKQLVGFELMVQGMAMVANLSEADAREMMGKAYADMVTSLSVQLSRPPGNA